MSDSFNWGDRWGHWKPKHSILTILAMAIGGIALAGVFAFLLGWIVMLLWNWLMPEIFRLPRIGYWQAWGLVLLSHILVKPGYGNGGDKGHKRPDSASGMEWRREMRERFHRKTPDGEPEQDET